MNTIHRGTKGYTTHLAAIIFLLLLMSWGANPSWSGATTYYVSPSGSDSNPGTQVSPWGTIQKAATTMVAGDTTIVMDGSYRQGPVNFPNSGTASQPITMKAQNKWRAILSSTPGCNPQVGISASYITIQDLRLQIDPSDTICGSGVNAASGTGVFAWSNNALPTPANPSTGWVGATIRGVWVDASSHRGHAIKTQQDYTIVENCVCYMGIEAINNEGTIFRGNTIYGPDYAGSHHAAKGGVRSFQSYNNVIHMTGTGWLGLIIGGATVNQYLWDPPSHVEAYNSVGYNNVVINETGTSPIRALGFMQAKDSALFNNVVIDGSLFTYTDSFATNPTINPTWKNNIVAGSGGAALMNVDTSHYTGTLTIDYNDFYNVTGMPSQPHAITSDPLFVNRLTDWHLQPGSPAIGSGIVLTWTGSNGELIPVIQDKDGVLRTVPWSLGIYATTGGAPDTTVPASPTNLRIQ